MTATETTPPPVTDQRLLGLAAFFHDTCPYLSHWPIEALAGKLRWYWSDARVGIVRHHGQIVAAATARCVDSPNDARDPWHHQEDGRIIWIEDIASRDPQGIPALLRIAADRFGPREAFAGSVFNRSGELRLLPWAIVNRMFQLTS